MLDTGFWRGRRVLVTGHTGFKGSWLCLWLQELGAQVVGFGLEPPTQPAAFDVARVGEGMTSVDGDVRDLDAVLEALDAHAPEVVIHMAAQSIVQTSYTSPLETYAVNVMGTATVLEALRRTGGHRVAVNVTSDKCYENREWVWGYREHEAMGGRDPYSSSKGCSELVTRAYRESFFQEPGEARVASARAGNVIGGGDWAPDRLVPDLVRAAIDGRSAVIRNPGAVRPWQHVLNPLSGYLLLAERLWDDPSLADAWNFGPSEEDAKPVGFVADRLRALWGAGLRWETGGDTRAHEASYLKVDSSKARAVLGWVPTWNLEDALESIVEWSGAYAEGRDMRAVTLDQLRRFGGVGASQSSTAASPSTQG